MTQELEGVRATEYSHQDKKEVARRDLEQEPLTPEELEISIGYYRAAYQERTTGPQLEGMFPEGVQAALTDPRTIAIERVTPDGRIVWPLLVPVEHNSEYRPGYFEGHMGEGAAERTFFYSNPDPDFLPPDAMKDMGFRELAQEKAVIVCDYHETDDDTTRADFLQLAAADEVRVVEPLATLEVGEQPRVLHFSGKATVMERTGSVETDLHKAFQARVERGEAEARPSNGAAILDPHEIATNHDGLADQLWEAYDVRFDDLVDDQPSMQKQTREQLMTMLSDSDAVTTAYFKEGKVVGFVFCSRNVRNCEWLDPDYYEKQFPNEELAIFPGMVVEKSQEGLAYSLPMLRTFSDAAAEANLDLRIIFQCTNISAQYIPRIVELGVNRTDGMRFGELEQAASYKYDVFQLEAGSTQPVSARPELTAA